MGQLDASIVTVAVPSIQRDLNAPLSSVEWVALVYLLVLVGSISAIGRLADVFGRKLLYIYGFGLFTIASLGCGLAPDMGWLLTARIFQAIGAAMLQANSVALIRTSMPAHKLGRAIGLQGAAQAIGLALGPSVGGLLIDLGGWRWVFFVNLPAGAIGILLGWYLLPRTRSKAARGRFDWAGMISLILPVGALLLAFSQATRLGFGDPEVLALLAGSAVLLAVFGYLEHRSRHPLVDLSLFRARNFTLGILSGLLCYLVLFGILFVTPLYLDTSHSLTSSASGLLLTALPVALGIIAPLGGYLADRHGSRLPTTTGMVVAGAGLATMAFGPASILIALVGLALAGFGLGLFTPANNATVAAAGHDHQAGMVSGVLNMTRGIGTSLGIAVAGAAYALSVGTSRTTAVDPAAATAGFRTAMTILVVLAMTAAVLAVFARPVRARPLPE